MSLPTLGTFYFADKYNTYEMTKPEFKKLYSTLSFLHNLPKKEGDQEILEYFRKACKKNCRIEDKALYEFFYSRGLINNNGIVFKKYARLGKNIIQKTREGSTFRRGKLTLINESDLLFRSDQIMRQVRKHLKDMKAREFKEKDQGNKTHTVGTEQLIALRKMGFV